jgi:hypothetical protein
LSLLIRFLGVFWSFGNILGGGRGSFNFHLDLARE